MTDNPTKSCSRQLPSRECKLRTQLNETTRKASTGVALVIENWEGKMVLVSCQCLVIYHEVKYGLTIQLRNSILCCLSKKT